MSWAKGHFSKELLEDFRNEHLTEAIGKRLVCEDNISRVVHEICFSFRYPWKLIINERDPASQAGYFINILSFSSQMLGKGVPPQKAQEAFAKAIRIKFNVQQDGSIRVPKTKIIPVSSWR